MNSTPRPLRFILVTLAVTLVWNTGSSFFGTGWISAAIISQGLVGVYVYYAIRYRDPVFIRTFILASAAGWVELLADYYLVHTTGTLIYPHEGPFVSASPLYMPFAWTLVLTQLGYIGWWLFNRYNLAIASICSALLVGINIPYYEWVAKSAHWWSYKNTPMLGAVVPWYIILGETLVGLALPFVVSRSGRSHWIWSAVNGLLLGLWIWVSYFISITITG